jgi:hypothetical protein
MRTAKNTTDADRVRLATRKGTRMLGPEEWQRCGEHPKKWESWRWTWPVDGGPEDGDPKMMRSCDHPDHERDDDT